MQFSIYDYKNLLLDGAGKEESLYVGTTATETAYGYMNHAGGKAEGGEISVPYFAEFRIKEVEEEGEPITLTVLGAKAVLDAEGAPQFNADKSPVEPEPEDFVEVGRLVIAEPDADEPIPYRVAVSSNKYKWFKAEVTGGKASAFLLRG
jgi:hypothetical protein